MKGLSAKMVVPAFVFMAIGGMVVVFMAASGGQQAVTGEDGDTIVQPGSEEIKDATLTANSIDVAGDSSSSVSDVESTIWKASSSDDYGTRLKTGKDIGGLTVSSGLSTNSAYTIVETDDNYYTEETGRADGEEVDQPLKSIQIESTQPVAEYHVKSVVSESDLSIAAYDDRNNELTSGSNSNQEDYEITLGSDDSQTVQIELSNSNDDAVYHAAGFAYKPLNDVASVSSIQVTDDNGDSVGTSTVAVPKHLQTNIAMNETDGLEANVSDYQNLVEFDQPVELQGNEDLTVTLDIESDVSNDPSEVDSGDLTTTDAFTMQFKDADHFTTPDLESGYGMFDESNTQNDVGLDESDNSPLGAESGLIIEAK